MPKTLFDISKGESAGVRRIRAGVYRVVYEVQDAVLTALVIWIGHRREIYR
jgi:mRNA interferase RelE/StbE